MYYQVRSCTIKLNQVLMRYLVGPSAPLPTVSCGCTAPNDETVRQCSVCNHMIHERCARKQGYRGKWTKWNGKKQQGCNVCNPIAASDAESSAENEGSTEEKEQAPRERNDKEEESESENVTENASPALRRSPRIANRKCRN